MTERVIVVGCGVAGMTAALRLASDPARRFQVEIVAERVAEESLSRVAAASFYPFAVNDSRLPRWLEIGRAKFVALASDPETGVLVRDGFEIDPRPVPGLWRSPVEFLLPPRGAADSPSAGPKAAHFALPIVEMPRYLPWLKAQLDRRGVAIRRVRLESLDAVAASGAIVVDCAGAEARSLVPDPLVKPTLGQLVRVTRGEIDRFALDERDETRPTYVVPRADDCILGSVDLPHDVDALGYEPPPPDPERTRQILERCAALDPRVGAARVIESYCGLRPRRDGVRLEVDGARLARGQRVIHDYGHGGAGVTLSWGCAEDVVQLAGDLAAARSPRPQQ